MLCLMCTFYSITKLLDRFLDRFLGWSCCVKIVGQYLKTTKKFLSSTSELGIIEKVINELLLL